MLPISTDRAVELLAEVCQERHASADTIYQQATLSTGVEVGAGIHLRLINNVPFLAAVNPITIDTLKERYLVLANNVPTFSVPRLFIASYIVAKLISLNVHYEIVIRDQRDGETVIKWLAGRKPGTWIGGK